MFYLFLKSHLSDLYKKTTGAREMAKWVKCLLCKHGDSYSDCYHPGKSQTQLCMLLTPELQAERSEYWGLTGQPV